MDSESSDMSDQEQQNQTGGQLESTSNFNDLTVPDRFPLYFKRADLDDAKELQNLVAKYPDLGKANDLLFDYPKFTSLIEKSYLSVTILNDEQKPIGFAAFNDYPQGLRGQIDFQHENFWEYWLFQTFDVEEDLYISPYNTLWMTYLFIANEEYGYNEEDHQFILEKLFQNIYVSLPNIEGILFLKRGESLGNIEVEKRFSSMLTQLFIQLPLKSLEFLRTVRGLHVRSEIYYSLKQVCTNNVVIRLAREQDHDDLAAIFNQQTEVLTSVYGEFYIADLIACQNLTRRISKQYQGTGKAIVGQVKQRAIGLMSVSTDIDYPLLQRCFDLESFDNLLKPEFMEAVRQHREIMKLEEKWKEEDSKAEKKRLLDEELMACSTIGQRICMQAYCQEKEAAVLLKIDEYLSNEDQQKTLTKEVAGSLIDEWMADFQIKIPSAQCRDNFDNCDDLETLIISPRQLLLEALECFGLPQDYMNGGGHWKDWAEQKRQEQKAAELRRPTRRQVTSKRVGRRKGGDKKDDEFKPPEWFDLQPFMQAFKKFTSVNCEMRTAFRNTIETSMRNIILLFCNEFGEMDSSNRIVDLNNLGADLGGLGLTLPSEIQENMVAFLGCFGALVCEKETVMIIPKDETDLKQQKPVKDGPAKRQGTEQTEKQPVQKILNKASWDDFKEAVATFKKHDLILQRLGLINNPCLQQDIETIELEESALASRTKLLRQKLIGARPKSKYSDLLDEEFNFDELSVNNSEIQNAIVINLFCIDHNYETRAQDFLEYVFSLFPDREYLILTQPFTAPELPLLRNFIHVQSKGQATFDHVLYLIHRDSLAADSITIRRSHNKDIQGFARLIEDLSNRQEIRQDTEEAIWNTASRRLAYTVYC